MAEDLMNKSETQQNDILRNHETPKDLDIRNDPYLTKFINHIIIRKLLL